MKNVARVALLSAVTLAGCNLTYDREGVKFGASSRDVEPNDTAGTSLPLTLGTDVTGTLGSDADLDYYAITVAAGTDVRFQTFDANGTTCDAVDPKITVYDAAGAILGANDDGGIGWCEDLTVSFPAAGTYFVAVQHSDYYAPPNDYLLRTKAAPSGGTYMTLSCDHGASGWCDEVTGTLSLSEVVTFQGSFCTGTFAEGPCPGSTLAGYCDAGAYPNATASSLRWIYYDPVYTQAQAESSCTTYSGTWVGGATLTVTPLFANAGANWNDWVMGSSRTSASDAACDPTAAAGCVHAGELRAVAVTGKNDCAGLTANDALGAFDWTCVGGSNPVRFVSTGLKPGRRLADLLDTGLLAWRPNSVTVRDGTILYGTTAAGRWWTNPIASVPASGALDAPGTIYVVSSATQVSVSIRVPHVALVVPPGTTLAPGTMPDVVSAATTEPPAGPRDYLWIEGAFDATGAGAGINLVGVRSSVVREASVTRPPGIGGVGFYLNGASRNRLENLTSSFNGYGVYFDQATTTDNKLDGATLEDCVNDCVFFQYAERNSVSHLTLARGGTGVLLFAAKENTVSDVSATGFQTGVHLQSRAGPPADPPCTRNQVTRLAVAANAGNGLVVEGADFNRFEGISATENSADGVFIVLARGNVLADVLAANNGGSGVWSSASNDGVFSAVTAARNGQAGIWLSASDANVVTSAALHGNGWRGLFLDGSRGNFLMDLAVGGSQTGIVEEGTSSDNAIHGMLVIGNNTVNCDQTSTVLPSFSSGCFALGLSDFTNVVAADLGPSFVRAVAADGVNLTPNSGGSVFVDDLDATWLDWTRFEHPHRAWASLDVGSLGCEAFPDQRQANGCGIWHGNGQLWDWSLRLGDGLLRGALPYPSTAMTHQWSDSISVIIVPRAIERLGDGIGNENGLCEATEDCVHTSNFGAYQGHGVLTFQLNVNGANLYDYSLNGR